MKTIMLAVLLLMVGTPAYAEVLYSFAPAGVVTAAIQTKGNGYVWYISESECYAEVMDYKKEYPVFVRCPDGMNFIVSKKGKHIVVDYAGGAQQKATSDTIVYKMYSAVVRHVKKKVQ